MAGYVRISCHMAWDRDAMLWDLQAMPAFGRCVAWNFRAVGDMCHMCRVPYDVPCGIRSIGIMPSRVPCH